eukprot:CAMPEP_0113943382 /NCGR_PEP_ID=MMETSP1339-20121228/23222_1 /TAXON_ID=94617 /ORGANISM="Fibrocapsa japonica" /LENGTH=93 /DNA_ID=CAMNT_0000948237 /DNA_START=221 /DNA_END=502 /DNA_ORIENTATION=- /assembly_acc=CAM_ASM_000762
MSSSSSSSSSNSKSSPSIIPLGIVDCSLIELEEVLEIESIRLITSTAAPTSTCRKKRFGTPLISLSDWDKECLIDFVCLRIHANANRFSLGSP